MSKRSFCGVSWRVVGVEGEGWRKPLKGHGSSATIGEQIAAKRNREMSNEAGRVSEIEADAQDPHLLLRRPR